MSEKNQSLPQDAPEDPSHPMPPPPELTYATQDQLFEAAQSWAREHGYAIIITHSTKTGPELRYAYQCDRSGTCHSAGKPEGQLTKTKKTNCPFKFTGNYYKREKQWRIVIKNAHHNHPPSENPSTHAVHRRMNVEQQEIVTNMTNAGVAPLQIKAALMQQTETPCTSTLNTIYNHRNKMRMDHLNGRSPVEALIFEIRNSNFYHIIQNHEGQMKALFFSHPNSLILARQFHTTFLLDCTYKTNKYKMPLLHIVGINSSNRSFSAAFCFLSGEKEEDYTWALEQFSRALDGQSPSVLATDKEQALLNAIEQVFPDASHLLCCWHITKNIKTQCHKNFKSEEAWELFLSAWNKLVASVTETDYQDNFTALSKTWNPATSDYLITNWLPIKHKFVAYIIHQSPHFGNAVTSRVEGLHAYVKRFIASSTGSFSAVVKQIHQAISVQLNERFIEASQQSYKQLIGLPPSIENLNGKITHYALTICHSFYKAKKVTTTCSGTYSSHMGIPCIHCIQSAAREGTKFDLNDFHVQWHVKQDLVSFFLSSFLVGLIYMLIWHLIIRVSLHWQFHTEN
jgi:hypothetical protein